MIVVDPEVTRRKFEGELERWREQEEVYRRRGWLMLAEGDLTVDIGFLGRLPGSVEPNRCPGCLPWRLRPR